MWLRYGYKTDVNDN